MLHKLIIPFYLDINYLKACASFFLPIKIQINFLEGIGMDIIPDKKQLSLIVDMASKGEVVLPEFQRNFVWRRDDITDLLVSIIKRYFIGTFLFLRVDRDNIPFAMRPITGVDKSENELNPEWMVLDGQQRITSLYYVFHAPDEPLKGTRYPYRFFLDLARALRVSEMLRKLLVKRVL